jgi:capsular exopolysaccharide synthesis family protein
MLFKRHRPAAVDGHLVSLLDPASFEAEQYRQLRHRVEDGARTGSVRVLAVTSAVAGDGKTVTAINLAAALAQGHGVRVLIIDADLRNPMVAAKLGIESTNGGLEAALLGPPAPLEQFVTVVDGSRLSILPCEASCDQTYELLTSPRLAELVAQARSLYDYVIVDTAPVLPVQDSILISSAVDGYIVVVSANSTPRALVGEALNRLDPQSLVGLVFNRDDRPLFGFYKGYYRRYFRSYVRSMSRRDPPRPAI